jgi:hypothetical protein
VYVLAWWMEREPVTRPPVKYPPWVTTSPPEPRRVVVDPMVGKEYSRADNRRGAEDRRESFLFYAPLSHSRARACACTVCVVSRLRER